MKFSNYNIQGISQKEVSMIDKLSGLFTNKISEYSSYSEEEIKKIDYALAVLLGESAKLIILYILFFFLGMLDFLIFSLIILITLRSFSGGIHFDSNFMCLIFTMLFFLITSYIFLKFILIFQIPVTYLELLVF